MIKIKGNDPGRSPDPPLSKGPKFLIIKRLDEEKDLTNLSPFLIKKVIINVTNGDIEFCKKLQSGLLLVKTKNETQAKKLLKRTAFSDDINVEVSLHRSLNYSKGVIYCKDLRDANEEDILKELKTSDVIEVKKIKKLINNELINTGLFILTFNTTNLPNDIYIGFEKTVIKKYIPNPLKCRNCYRFGHPTAKCKSEKLCVKCGEKDHDPEVLCEKNERNCASFKKQIQINAIMINDNIDRKAATIKYNQTIAKKKTALTQN